MAPIVECRGLTKSYGGKLALNHICLNLERGRIIGLLGPNGSGKSTLIKIMNGLLKPSGGEIRIDGQLPGVDTKYRISYLPERTYLPPGMKVIEILQYFEDFYPDFRVERAYDMLSRLQIPPNERLKNLSKGTKEKVQLVLVMSRDASLYVLDEPIAGVDPASRDYILHTILSNYNREATILLSTHLIADVESILDEVVFIKYGNIILQAPAAQIRQREGKSVDRFFREVFAC
jgi:ABC-2 type transport system ATP-binding protein